MATTRNYHITQKELKQPDEFVSLADRAWQYVTDNSARVILAVVTLVALAAVGIGVNFYFEHRDRIIADRFYDALTALNHKHYKDAEDGFSSLAREGAGSLTELSRLGLASAYMADHQPAAARDALRPFLGAGENPALRNLALVQLAVAEEDLGDFKQAHEAYLEAATLKGPEQGVARLGVARTLARLGDTAGAIAAYRAYLAENPYSQERSDVVESLAQLGAAPATMPPAPAGGAAAAASRPSAAANSPASPGGAATAAAPVPRPLPTK